jgi:hypothetical protein
VTRIPIIDRTNMSAEQARVYDAAKQSTGIVGGPYLAYIRLPKLFEASQNLRACLASGPLSRREQQIVNLTVARYWNARYPWYAQVRNSLGIGIEQPVIEAINTRKAPALPNAREQMCFAVANEMLANKGLSDASGGENDGAGKPGRAGRSNRQLFHDLPDRRHLRHRSARQ